MKLFLYARKSTDVEDKQAMSIERQLHELHEFAARERITICAEIIEKQSAKVPGRPLFNDMMDRLEAGEADGILAWHPDRLSRNGVDGGRIMYAIDTGKVAALKFPTFWFENTPQGKFMLNMAFSQSKYYVDSLSENTKSGLQEKVRRGEYPGPAPIGYLNDYRTKRLAVDKERAPIVREAFERYATGKETQETLRHFFGERGIRSRTGKLLGNTCISSLLTNPILYGHFRYRGEVHEGVHEAIISKKLFDDVQAVIDKRWRYSREDKINVPKKPFLELFRCAECGGGITAEIQKGHTYYRCTKKNRKKRCRQPYVREEILDAEITALILPCALPPDWADEMLKRIKKEKHEAFQSASAQAELTSAEVEKINRRLQLLLDSFLDEMIDRETFAKEKAKLMSTKKTLEERKSAQRAGRADWLEPFEEWIKTAKNTGEIAVSDDLFEKKALAKKIFGSNLILDSKKARGSCVKPWSFIAEKSQTGGMVRGTGFEPVSYVTECPILLLKINL